MGWPRRRHGIGRAGRPVPDSRGVSARTLSAGLRSSRRLVECRRERLGRHDLLDPAPRQEGRAEGRGLPAEGHRAGGRGLRDLRPVDDAGAHGRQGHARLHARSRGRQLHPDAPRPAHSRGHQRVRDQHQQRAVLGDSRAPLRHGVPGRQVRRARPRLQHALDRVDGGRGASHPGARRRVHVPARHPRSREARAPAPDVRSQPDQLPGGAGGRRRVDRTRSGSWSCCRTSCTSACR